MRVTFDRDTKDLCEDDYNPFVCPHCRKTLSIDARVVCAAKGKEVHLYHADCMSDEKEEVLEEVGYDVSWGTGIDFVDD
jgi:hypothetical protein